MAAKKKVSEKKKAEVRKAMFANLESDGKIWPKSPKTGERTKPKAKAKTKAKAKAKAKKK